MNIGNLWTLEEESKLLDEINDKLSVEIIAKNHGRTKKAIEMRIESMIKKQYQENYSISVLSSLYHKTEEEIQNIIKESKTLSTNTFSLSSEIENIKIKLDKIEKILIKIYKKNEK
jgi:hypothetical protein